MKKFFLFRKEEISLSSSKASDTGKGVSVFAIEVDNLAFMTAYKGVVDITFNNASLYESSGLFKGESIEKTNVNISCPPGEELSLMENILDFISRDGTENVMKFDVAEGKSTFKKALVSDVSNVSTKIKVNPSVMSSGRISRGDTVKQFSETVAEIFFGDNLPSLDFNHEGLADYANGDEITSWHNAGTSGTTHSIASNQGAPEADTDLDQTGLSRVSAGVAAGDFFIVPNSYTVSEEYTIYMCIRPTTLESGLGVVYGDGDGATIGFCFERPTIASDGGIHKSFQAVSTFRVRHGGRTGEPAFSSTKSKKDGTIPYEFPENSVGITDGSETCHVFIIRRDKNHNMYLHNRTGDLVGFIPGFSSNQTSNQNLTSDDFMTDGPLLIEQIGSAGSFTGTTTSGKSFQGGLARFGVIEKDIGVNASVKLAEDLFNLYNF